MNYPVITTHELKKKTLFLYLSKSFSEVYSSNSFRHAKNRLFFFIPNIVIVPPTKAKEEKKKFSYV